MVENTQLKKRILDLSFKHKLSHIGSCLTAADIIDEIYDIKKPDEKFILSSGHAGLALYCVIEEYEGVNAEQAFLHHGVHPDRCTSCHLYCSTGSLGHGLGIALGMALADRSRNVYCLISDGECSEGSIWEALQVQREQKIDNLYVCANINGYGAYKKIDVESGLLERLEEYGVAPRFTDMDDWPDWLQGQQAHYVTMNEGQYKEALKVVE